MGMSIDEAIKMQEEIIDEGWLISDLEKCPAIDSCKLAINIMRKYQKIEQIYERFQKDGNYYHHMAWLDVMEVIQDGNSY